MCCYSYALEYLEQDSNNTLKQFFSILTINFKKNNVNYKSLNKINLVFKIIFEHFALYFKIYIADPLYFIFQKMQAIFILSALSLKA